MTKAAAQQASAGKGLNVGEYGNALFVGSFVMAHVQNLTVNAPLLLRVCLQAPRRCTVAGTM
jgi:hypothetical protein